MIHEGQLTFADRGLHLIQDLGEWWFGETGLPLPLGGNVVRKDLGDDLTRKISRHLRDSIAYGLEHRAAALDHSMQYARGLDRSKADAFVGMYVNDWTLDYGEAGRRAVQQFLQRGVEAGIIAETGRDRVRRLARSALRAVVPPPRVSLTRPPVRYTKALRRADS